MTTSRLTLSEQFFRDQADAGATGGLSTVLNRFSLIGRMLASEIMRAGFVGKLGYTGTTNVQDENVRALDVISNDLVMQIFDTAPMVAGIASEEMEDVYLPNDGENGKYIVATDPLDGSGNVDVAGQMGTIFAIWKRVTKSGKATTEDFLQPGRDMVAAGYILYGPCTMMVYSAGGPVNGFTLDRSIGTFFLTHPDIRIPEGAGSYAVNEANEAKWDDATRDMVRAFRMQQTECGKRSARYSGALVGDFHRTLLKGGIYMYPGEVAKPQGKLRLLYENAPLTFLCERAGGLGSMGKQLIRDVMPQELHQRTPLFLGSKGDVEEAVRRLG
ncbi:MAG: class 1 fructose-bisphosphatase [Planctomycetes bacterium]|nr:class 1 fructose-bisphosphatase [Planctomycetota bacterium]